MKGKSAPGWNVSAPEVAPMPESAMLTADAGNCGRVTERSSLTRPRYQKESLKAVGKNSWKIRWREDLVNADGSMRRIYRKETLRQMTKAQALEVLDAHLSVVKNQQRQPGI